MKLFLSFSDSRLSTQRERIKKQAMAMDSFDQIHLWDESNLSSEFRLKFKEKLIIGSRGYGYWCWKHQVVLQAFDLMSEGDVLCYVDSGCHLNPKGRARLHDYFKITAESRSGILTFQGPWLDGHWTKGDLLQKLEVASDKNITHTGTLIGGIFLARKSSATVELFRSCLQIIKDDFALIDDSPSRSPNLEGFKEHRHDQSIFSILCKKMNAETLPYEEVCPPLSNEVSTMNRDNHNSAYPIIAKRDWSPCNPFTKMFLKILALMTPIRSYRRKIRNRYSRHPS